MDKLLLISHSQIVGQSEPEETATAFYLKAESLEKKEIYGELYGVLDIKGPAEIFEASLASRELLKIFQEAYFEKEVSSGIFSHLRSAVKKIAEEAGNLAYSQKIEMEINLTAGVVWGEILYLTTLGAGKAMVKRGEKMSAVIKREKIEEEKIEMASGVIKDGDLVILGTRRFWEIVDDEILEKSIDDYSVEEIAERLAPVIHQEKETGRAGGMFLSFALPEVPSIEEEGLELREPVLNKPINKYPNFKSISNFKFQINKLISGFIKKIRLPGKEVYVKKEEEEEKRKISKKLALTAAAVLAVFLMTSVVLGVRKRNEEKQMKEVRKVYEEVLAKYEEGEALMDLNPGRARMILAEADEKIRNEKLKIKNCNSKCKIINNLGEKIAEALTKVSREYKTEAKVFMELGLIKEGAEGKLMDISDNNIIVGDKNGSVYKIGIKNKKSEIMGKIEEVKFLTSYGKNIYGLRDDGIVALSADSAGSGWSLKADKDWEQAVDMEAYAGNLYVLDKAGRIIKFQGTDTGFTKRDYLAADIKPDFSQAASMSIDGSVWVLLGDGHILKFTRGKSEELRVSGLDKPFNGPAVIFTDDEAKKLYVLDKGNKRIVVLNKLGEYDSQYVWEGMGNIEGMEVAEEAGKIFLLEKEKIWEIEIKKS